MMVFVAGCSLSPALRAPVFFLRRAGVPSCDRAIGLAGPLYPGIL